MLKKIFIDIAMFAALALIAALIAIYHEWQMGRYLEGDTSHPFSVYLLAAWGFVSLVRSYILELKEKENAKNAL